MLNEDIVTNKAVIQKKLQRPVLVIPNALDADIAENLYQALKESSLWSAQDTQSWRDQGYDLEDFEYRRDHIDIASQSAPAPLKEMNTCFNSPKVRQWFSFVSGRPCDRFIASATLFNPGDHISEHNDQYIYQEPGQPRYSRALTFNYYLSKNWDASWGGNLIWKDPYECIIPSFNTLVLFNVTENSYHWVEPVKPAALAQRFSITGWFLSEIRLEAFSLSLGS